MNMYQYTLPRSGPEGENLKEKRESCRVHLTVESSDGAELLGRLMKARQGGVKGKAWSGRSLGCAMLQ